MSAGRPFGAETACQDCTSAPLTPDSDSVGTFGSTDERLSPVIASTLSLPALMWLSTELMFMKPASTWPPSRSEIAGPPPL